ncbi:putative cysteine desulfurase [Candidatus Methylobacter favarea]|uniref:cysteine desulfurase n=1 Tax=Candidatus Methylobacter favarea TaxID=2707345 RepID=A0A8S0XHG8_9GAMM|nr:family 2A encapsulin nanocompartment cargo protein cysteine desulfurase [Candidatus Methylobacter favarea]CAA9891851.1 putative cysteine desulfurase [Candidatus Methylobacter favarea]
MNTSEFDKSSLAQQSITETLGQTASLPDIDELTKLANELFSALPCDGSRLGIVASAVPGGLSSPLAGIDKSGVTGIIPQGFALPGEAELRQLFAPRKPSLAQVPHHLDTGPVLSNPPSTTANGSTSSLAGLDQAVLAGIFPHDFGLPVEAELQQLLVSRPPSGSRIPGSVDAGSIPAIPTAAAANELTAEALAESEKSAETGISSPVYETELQKLFAINSTATGRIPKSATSSSIPGIPTTTAPPALTGSLADLDALLIAGLSPEVYGLPGEVELQKLFAAFSAPSGSIPASAGSSFYFLDELKTGGLNAQTPTLASAHPPFDVHAVRRDFPILKERVNGYPLAWFDNAATTQKPQVVIDRVSYFYEHENSNIHRAAHELAARATDAYEKARDTVARFLNAPSSKDIIFVRGTTEAINLVAQSWGRQNLVTGDEIVITWLEHHANIVPWQLLCEVTGAKLRVAPVDDSGQVLLGDYQKLLNSRTRLVSFTHVSNALGTVTPAQEIIAMAHRVGARALLDAAQSVSHLHVDVQALDCDWCAFSGHKIFGPTGIGALYGKAELLESMPPWQGGGSMIDDVTFEKTTFQPAPTRFEAGTGNIADAVGLGTALDYLTRIGIHNVARYEHELLVYGMEALKSIPGLRLIGTAAEKTSALSFVLAGYSNEDIGVALNKVGIAVRTGHHCAQPILRRFGLESMVRPSLAFYNTYEEIDRLVSTIRQIQGGKRI